MTRLTMREQNEALFMWPMTRADCSKHDRTSGKCLTCLKGLICPWCLEDW